MTPNTCAHLKPVRDLRTFWNASCLVSFEPPISASCTTTPFFSCRISLFRNVRLNAAVNQPQHPTRFFNYIHNHLWRIIDRGGGSMVARNSGMLRLRRLHITAGTGSYTVDPPWSMVIHRQKGIAPATSSASCRRMLPFSWFWFARVRAWRSLTHQRSSSSRPLKWDSPTWATRMWGTRLLGTILAKTPQRVPRWIRLDRGSPLTIAYCYCPPFCVTVDLGKVLVASYSVELHSEWRRSYIRRLFMRGHTCFVCGNQAMLQTSMWHTWRDRWDAGSNTVVGVLCLLRLLGNTSTQWNWSFRCFGNLRLPSSVNDNRSYKHYCINTCAGRWWCET